MKKMFIVGMLLLIITLPTVGAAMIAVDVSHGEGTVALVSPIVDPTTGKVIAEGIIPTLSWYEWGYFGYSYELNKAGVKRLGDTITYDSLKDVDVLIIGKLREELSPDEIRAIVKWFSEGQKVLWISGDSERELGAYVQKNANALLEAIPGAKLRIDYVTTKDTFSYAGKTAYVSGFVRVDIETPDGSILTKGYQGEVGKVLFHEPGVLAWVDENQKWHKLVAGEIPPGVYRIVTTSGNGVIEDDYAPEGRTYASWEQGLFTLLAVEFVELPEGGESLLIVSAESPYGDPVPIWVNRYGSYLFDGQQFVTNLLRWALLQSEKMTPRIETTTTITTATTTTTTTTTETSPTTTTRSPSPTTSSESPSFTTSTTTVAEENAVPTWIIGVIMVLGIGALVLAFLLLRGR